jgi:hypothetical protein
MSKVQFRELSVGDQIQTKKALFGVPKDSIGVVLRKFSYTPDPGWEVRWMCHPAGRKVSSEITLCWARDAAQLTQLAQT